MNDTLKRQVVRVNGAAWVLVAVLASLASARAEVWEIGTVDGSIGGSYASLRFDKYGNGHVAYADEASGQLQYSFWDHSLDKWFTTSLPDRGGFCSLVLDSKQHPHISYASNSHLKHTYWDGSIWRTETVPVPTRTLAFYTSIALDANDNPSMTYYEVDGPTGEQTARLKVVTKNGKVWELMTVDQTYGSGKFNSIAFDSVGNLHIAYGNVIYENSSLRFADWNGTTWHDEILEGAGIPGTYRQAVMMILDKHDAPHIAYSDILDQIVKYATRVNGKWQIEAVDSIGRAAYPDRNGIALDEQGAPYLSYYDAKNGVLKVAYRKEKKWVYEVVDQGFAGFTSSLQIDDGTIWLTYSGGPGGGLRFARRRLAPPKLETQAPEQTIQK